MKKIFLSSVMTFFFTFACLLKVTAADDSVSNTGFFLDTVITITVNGTSDRSVIDECFSLINEYENLFSRTREGSDIWNVNHSNGHPTAVSEDTAFLIDLSRKYSELSDNAFDISVAPYIELWDFQNNPGTIPSQEVLAKASDHVSFDRVALEGTTVTLLDSEASIDLGGIAKGYIADKVKELLLSKGFDSALLNLGGNVLTVGSKPDGSDWKIGIRKPFGEATDIIAVLPVSDQSVVTSGTYERYFEKDGIIYHHILDPATGYPVQNSLQSVTILSDSSADGDALSTTCFVLGIDKALTLIESLPDIEAMFITDDGEMHYTSGFPKS